MSLKIILNLFIDHPLAAIISLLFGGGILFGLIGGLTGIEFFLDHWMTLIGLGALIILLSFALELLREGY
ncbi:MAG TPA: hypothetical protein ENI49_06995 [Thermoplasmatales archaeon]|nr:hypothetical protein [Thermoplasmatales archaeon]